MIAIPILGIVGLLYTYFKTAWVSKQDPGTEKMQAIAKSIAEVARAFLKAEYKVLVWFVLIAGILMAVGGMSDPNSSWVAGLKAHSVDKPVIVMGDFNSLYTRIGDSIETMLDLGFKDVWLELIRKGSIPEKGNSLTACDPRDRNAFDCEKVDKVFYRSNDKVLFTPLTYQLDDSRYYYQNNDSLPLTDHWPLHAKLIYTVLK